MVVIQMAEIEIDIEMAATAAVVAEMTVIEADNSVANSIPGSADLMAPQKVAPSVAVEGHLAADVLFATAAISLEQGRVVPLWKREKSAQEQETAPKDPLVLFLFFSTNSAFRLSICWTRDN